MKRCPQCGREFDVTMSYCLDDGSELLYGPAIANEPRTAILSDIPSGSRDVDGESATRPLIDVATASDSRSSGVRRITISALAALLILGAGFLGYRYFTAGAKQINSIAVLPFENRSGNADAEYLSDGLTDSLIFRFAQLPDLKVSPTSSVMRYKGDSKDVADIAKELDVDAVLSGRLTQIGDALTISVQLIDARTKKLLWAEQYDRKMADLLATQREIATTITQKLQLRLTGNETGIAKKYTSSNEAYQLYLKGRFHWAKRKKEDMLLAVDAFKQAIALDPNFALAYVGIAEAYNSMGKNPDVPPSEAIPLGKAAAMKAIEFDPNLAEAHSALADSLAIGDWNWTESEKEFHKAIELDPNVGYIHVAYSGSYLTAVGRTDEAAAETARAVELEPVALINNALHVASLINARRYDDALAQARKAYELDREFPLSRHWLGTALAASGKFDEAIALGREVPDGSPLKPIGLFVEGYAEARAGRRSDADATIGRMKELAKTVYIRPYYLAAIYAAMGDNDHAFTELERSFQERDCYLPRMRVDPALDPIRADPRFKDLLKRMNLAD